MWHHKNDLTLLFARVLVGWFSLDAGIYFIPSRDKNLFFLNHWHAHKKMSWGLALLNLTIVPANRSGWSTVWSHLLQFWRPWTCLLTGHSKRRTCQEGLEVTVEWRITHFPFNQMARISAPFFAFFYYNCLINWRKYVYKCTYGMGVMVNRIQSPPISPSSLEIWAFLKWSE